jgi:hypothetical protein
MESRLRSNTKRVRGAVSSGIEQGVPMKYLVLPMLLLQTGCSVLAVADAGVSVAGAAVSVVATTVNVGAKAVGAAVDAVLPDTNKAKK